MEFNYLKPLEIIDYSHQFTIFCEKGELDFVKYFVECLKIDNISEGLISACKGGKLEIVKYLDKAHRNREMKVFNILCVGLNIAHEKGYLEIMLYLLTSIQILDNNKYLDNWVFKWITIYNGLEYACENGHLGVVKYFIKQENILYLLNTYVEDFKVQRYIKFASSKMGKEIVYINGINSAFQKACENEQFEIVEFLVENEYIKNLDKSLSVVCKSYTEKSMKIINYLKEKGANIFHLYVSLMNSKNKHNNNFNKNLIILYDPVYCILINSRNSKKSSIKRLPIELLRMLREFI